MGGMMDWEKGVRDQVINDAVSARRLLIDAEKRVASIEECVAREVTAARIADICRECMGGIDWIVLHHSLTTDGETVSWGAIRRYHTETLGWRDIGYHFGIESIQGHVECLLGRVPGTEGAHTRGLNKHSVGICCVGNFDLARPPRAVWDQAVALVQWLMRVYKLGPAQVIGHREAPDAHKTCPGTMWDMDAFRAALAG